jgi:hypothetical protein
MGIPKKKPDIHVDKSLSKTYAWKDNTTIERIIKSLASNGLPDKEIAGLMGIRLGTLQRRVNTNPNLKKALVEGRDEATQIVVSRLFNTAVGGNITQEIKERINHKGQKTTEIKTVEMPPNALLLMYWLNNMDPDNWKDRNALAKEQKENSKIVSSTTESDKIARLSAEVFKGDTNRAEGEHSIPKETAQPTGEGTVDAGHLQGDVRGEATDNLQDNALDVSTETGAVNLQTPSV